ncbi:MAG: GAF domain-containing protein [Hyphomonadaceae bacterium]|nr:MAG: GAF domain-containing protein [Hyphomonadaceae bacterium]KAF0186207.1 MAG: GAF domain-containing protein [Hyphomonadaceae bacterium]
MDKKQAYKDLARDYAAVVAGETNQIARMATLVSMLVTTFGARFFWCGYYLVDENKQDELVIGPYQGSLGCLRIPFSRGVCGKAARTKQTQIVEDVHAFAGHIACDSRSNSEIVVPVFDGTGRLLAVLDVDSTDFAAFDAVDALGLEALCALI